MDVEDLNNLQTLDRFHNVGVRLRDNTVKSLLQRETLLLIHRLTSTEFVCDIIKRAMESEHRGDILLIRDNYIIDLCVEQGWAGKPSQWQFWDYTKSNVATGVMEW